MISVAGLTHRYSATVALDDISFDVARGEVVGLLGPNGAGKSTCMRILTGFMPPTRGRVTVGGRSVSEGRAMRRGIGYLPEGVPLYPEMRVDELLTFRARIKGVPRRQRPAELDRVADLCGIADVRSRIVRQLSRGYRQRLGLADALLGAPPLLVLDEPTAGLDPNQIREVRALIRALGDEHTVLVSSHILTEVEATCDRVIILHQGCVAAQGSVAEMGQEAGQGWILRARAPREPLVAALEALDVVAAVTALDASTDDVQHVKIRCTTEADDAGAEAIVAAVTAGGWGVRELSSSAESLEQVFARLTEGPAAPVKSA